MGKFKADDKVVILDSTLSKIGSGRVLDVVTSLTGELLYPVVMDDGQIRTYQGHDLYAERDVHIPPERPADKKPPVFQLRDLVTSKDSMIGRNKDMRITAIICEKDGTYSYECARKENPSRKIFKERNLIPARGSGR